MTALEDLSHFQTRMPLGAVVRYTGHRIAWGNMSRLSLLALCLPPREKGWHGGPPATMSTQPTLFKSNFAMLPSKTMFGSKFARNEAHASLLNSTNEVCSSPEVSSPFASPPVPENLKTFHDWLFFNRCVCFFQMIHGSFFYQHSFSCVHVGLTKWYRLKWGILYFNFG